jgi:ubiquinone/menaquinone biosynthesis C-methylase UbiE
MVLENSSSIICFLGGLKMSHSLKNTERFSNRVENYVKYRPEYPKEFIEYLYTNAGFSKESIIADIGSGTGKLTSLLLERESRVVGVEPNKEMRKAAEKLLAEHPKFVSIDGTAEATGLPDSSVNFIVCAQAFHWFDNEACRKEFSRILKPGGKVALVWNKRMAEERGFPAEYEKILKAFANDYNEVNHKLITDEEFKRFFRNGAYHQFTCRNEQLFDFESLKGRLLSSSYAPMPGEQNYEVLMTEMRQIFDTYCTKGKVAIKYETEGYIGEV